MLFGDPGQFIINALYLIPALLVGLIGHELAHAAVAVSRGDQTPRLDGRLSLDPSHHLDPLGTIAIFFIGFGWAKPVRINPLRMHSALDPGLVALAGPLANLFIAVLLSLPIKRAFNAGILDTTSPAWRLLVTAFFLNVALAVLNLLPIPPLDGYNFLASVFRRRFAEFFFWIDSNRYTIMLVFIVVVVLGGFLGLSFLPFLYRPVANLILRLPPFPVSS